MFSIFLFKRQILDVILITISSVLSSLLEMFVLIYVFAVVSGTFVENDFLSSIVGLDALSHTTIIVVAAFLILCKSFVLIYSSISCRVYAKFLYKTAFNKFICCSDKLNIDWNSLFAAHLNIASNSVYRSVLSLCSSVVYFLVFFVYISSTISMMSLMWVCLLLACILGGMIPIFYLFRKVSPNIVSSFDLHLNYILTLNSSRVFYFSGIKAGRIIKEFYNSLITKLKFAQAVQQFFSELPRFLFEVILIFLVVSLLTTDSGGDIHAGSVMLLIIRLLPVFSTIFANFSNIFSNRTALKTVGRVISYPSPLFNSNQETIQGLSYSDLTLVHNDKSFTYKNEIFHFDNTIYRIAGASGSGKSSLLSALIGHREIISGHILVNDGRSTLYDFYKNSVFVSSDFEMPDALRVKDFITHRTPVSSSCLLNDYSVFFPELLLKNISCDDFLELTGEYVSNQFSAGQKQRLAHFIGLHSGADILISDEGFCHIDDNLKFQIMHHYLAKSVYKGIIVVEHDSDFLQSFSTIEVSIENKK